MTRRIVEIKQPDNHYFEKAVFYCRTNIPKTANEVTLTQEAERIISRLCAEAPPPPKPLKRSKLRNLLKTAVSVAAGAFGAFLLFKFQI